MDELLAEKPWMVWRDGHLFGELAGIDKNNKMPTTESTLLLSATPLRGGERWETLAGYTTW